LPVSIHPQVRIVVRPYGSGVPLGFLAFGIGMFMYAAQDIPWVQMSEARNVGLVLTAFVAPLEGVAAIIAFLARDTMAAVALGLFTGSWLFTGYSTMHAKPGVLSAADGYFLIAFTIAVLVLAGVAWLGQPLIAALLTVAAARGITSAVYQLGGGRGWDHVSGWIALAIFCVAMYGGLAFLLEDAKGRAVFPIGRRGTSHEAIHGDLEAQLAGLAGEPGVRKAL
jgi:succinate-acetate transporter protein